MSKKIRMSNEKKINRWLHKLQLKNRFSSRPKRRRGVYNLRCLEVAGNLKL